MLRLVLMILPAGLLLAACSRQASPPQPPARDDDPLMAAMLDGPIMVDPDLIDRNTVNQLASFAPLDGSIPLPNGGSDEADAARQDAAALAGGDLAMQQAPAAPATDSGKAMPAGLLAQAAALGKDTARCAAGASDTFAWAARMPQVLPVYPRAAVREAHGSDAGNCDLRAVSFETPVSSEDVLDFYTTMAHTAGFTVRRELSGQTDVLTGTRSDATYWLAVRAGPAGLTQVDLVTSGA